MSRSSDPDKVLAVNRLLVSEGEGPVDKIQREQVPGGHLHDTQPASGLRVTLHVTDDA